MKKYITLLVLLFTSIVTYSQSDVALYNGKTENLEVISSLIDNTTICKDDSLNIVSYIDINKSKVMYHIIDNDTISDNNLKGILYDLNKKEKKENHLNKLYVYYIRLLKTLNK